MSTTSTPDTAILRHIDSRSAEFNFPAAFARTMGAHGLMLTVHRDCAFCMGRAAAHEGETQLANPFVTTDAAPGTPQWHESDHGFWLAGYDIGFSEASAPDGNELRERTLPVVRAPSETDAATAVVRSADPEFVMTRMAILVNRVQDVWVYREIWRVQYWARPVRPADM